MTDAEIDAYLADALTVCPPPTIVNTDNVGGRGQKIMNLGSTNGAPRNRMAPKSSLAKQLVDEEMVEMMKELGMSKVPVDPKRKK